LATGNNNINSLKNIEKLKNRDITLFPCLGEYAKWKATADGLNKRGWNIKVDNFYQDMTENFGYSEQDYTDYILYTKSLMQFHNNLK
jgi:hypothetical protein